MQLASSFVGKFLILVVVLLIVVKAAVVLELEVLHGPTGCRVVCEQCSSCASR